MRFAIPRLVASLLVVAPVVAWSGGVLAEGDASLAAARSALEAGNDAEALAIAERVLTNDPKSAAAHRTAGVAAHRLGRLRLAETHLRKAARLDAGLPGIEIDLADLLGAQAEEYRTKGKPKIGANLDRDAIEIYDRALETNPTDPRALAGRSRVLLQRGETDRALASLEAWSASEPDNTEAALALAEVYARTGRVDASLEQWRRVHEADDSAALPRALYATTLALYENDRPGDAKGMRERLRPIEGDSWRMLGLDALGLLEEGRPYDAAQKLLAMLDRDAPRETVLRLAQSYHSAYLRLGRGRAGAESSGWTLPRLTFRTVPSYPERARTRGLGGSVLLLVDVEADGTTSRVEVIGTSAPRYVEIYGPMFAEAAVASVREWTYEPATRDGVPTSLPIPVEIGFAVE